MDRCEDCNATVPDGIILCPVCVALRRDMVGDYDEEEDSVQSDAPSIPLGDL